MSITNVQLITDALRALNVIRESQTPNANQQANVLRFLNQMMFAWEADGTVLGYFEQTTPSDTCPIPQWAEMGVTYMLALAIAGDYGADPLASVIKRADDGYQTILRTVENLKLEGADMRHLPVGSGHWGDSGYDITTDR